MEKKKNLLHSLQPLFDNYERMLGFKVSPEMTSWRKKQITSVGTKPSRSLESHRPDCIFLRRQPRPHCPPHRGLSVLTRGHSSNGGAESRWSAHADWPTVRHRQFEPCCSRRSRPFPVCLPTLGRGQPRRWRRGRPARRCRSQPTLPRTWARQVTAFGERAL